MYEPFEQAIDRYQEGEHVKPFDAFVSFLEKCDTCKYRIELQCPECECRGGKSCIRLAELPGRNCPLESL